MKPKSLLSFEIRPLILIVGMILVAVGVWCWSPPAALVVIGGILILDAMRPNRREHDRPYSRKENK